MSSERSCPRVLVTGAGGFAGTHFTRLCAERGAEIVGIAGREQLDLRDAPAVRAAVAEAQPDWVVHLAAEASVARSLENPARVIEANVATSMNLLEALRLEAPDAAVLMAGSGEEYGRVEYLPLDERHPLAPQNPYASSKAMVDLLAASYEQMHGMRVIRMRAFNHTGPGQSDTYVVGKFARQIAEAEAQGAQDGRAEITTGNLSSRRDFSDVRDVVRGYWMALDSGVSGVYNVCSGHATPVSDILTTLAAHSSLDVQSRVDPARLRENEVMEIVGSHEKLTQATGWQPEIELSQTLLDALNWWRERVAAGAAR